jgi:tetratricopeptide (TPR) repeat protein
LEGRFDDARLLIPRAYEFGRHALPFNAATSYRLQMFLLHKECGTPPYPEEALTKLIAEAETYRILRCALASLLVDRGRDAEARAIFRDFAEDDFGRLNIDEEWLAAMTLLSEVCDAIGDVDRAPTIYERLLPYRKLNAWGFPEILLGSVERPLGILATMIGEWHQASEHFERALEMNARIAARPWIAHTQHDYARMLLARDRSGDRARAEALLTNAVASYRDLGMKPWVGRAERELSAVGASPSPR